MKQKWVIDRVKYLISGLIFVLVLIGSGQATASDPNPPERCAGFGDLRSFSLTNWDTGLPVSWAVGTREISNPGIFHTDDWAVVGSLPGSRPGKAAFVANVEYVCEEDVVDETGVLYLESPTLAIPGGAQVPRISVVHRFGTEVLWDGGNFKISVNSGPFELIPGSAIEVGTYNSTLRPAENDMGDPLNENPLAGQDAFSTDGNAPVWGESHINLLGIAAAGDNIQLRFEFGIDECNGWIGWYVDDVEFYSCSAEVSPGDTSLTLVKQVINNNGGNAPASAWTLSASGPSPFSGSGPSVSSGAGLIAGKYTLTESGGPAGYSASAGDCVGGSQLNNTVTIASGQVVTCTITNDDIKPTLKVVKTIINDSGGTESNPNAFGLKVNGSSVLHNVTNSFNAGNYTVSETGLPGYQPGFWGGDCSVNGSITLAVGDTATCTITNNDISPTLKVIKNIINDNGGTVFDPNAFGLRVDGSAVQHNVKNNVNAGSHLVSEDGLPDYKAGKWGGDCNEDGSITLVLDQDATCTITNNDIDPFEIMFKDGFE